MIRFSIYILLFFTALLGILIVLAHFMEERIHDIYGHEFNYIRLEKGITPLAKFDNREDIYWSDFVNSSAKWQWILTNKEIGTETHFYNDSIFDRPYHYSKDIYYGTQIFFWQNFYGGEIDIFLNPVSQDTTLQLTIIYQSAAVTPGDFFYTDLDTLYPDKPDIFICGTPFIENENFVPQGNISKAEADKILEKWRIGE